MRRLAENRLLVKLPGKSRQGREDRPIFCDQSHPQLLCGGYEFTVVIAAAMPHPHHQHHKAFVNQLANQPVVADAFTSRPRSAVSVRGCGAPAARLTSSQGGQVALGPPPPPLPPVEPSP